MADGLKGSLHAIGRNNGSSGLSSVEWSNGARWVAAPGMTTKRFACAATVLEGGLYVIRGKGSGSFLSGVERFNSAQYVTWRWMYLD